MPLNIFFTIVAGFTILGNWAKRNLLDSSKQIDLVEDVANGSSKQQVRVERLAISDAQKLTDLSYDLLLSNYSVSFSL